MTKKILRVLAALCALAGVGCIEQNPDYCDYNLPCSGDRVCNLITKGCEDRLPNTNTVFVTAVLPVNFDASSARTLHVASSNAYQKYDVNWERPNYPKVVFNTKGEGLFQWMWIGGGEVLNVYLTDRPATPPDDGMSVVGNVLAHGMVNVDPMAPAAIVNLTP